MSCIIAYNHKEYDKIYLGSDSLITTKSGKSFSKNVKTFIKKDILFGIAGNVKLLNIIHYNMEIPSEKEILEIYENPLFYFNGPFEEKLRKYINDSNYMQNNNGTTAPLEGIIIINNQIYKIEPDLSIVEYELNDYVSVGSGSSYALGALWELSINDEFSVEKKIEFALEAAQNFDSNVQKPFTIYSYNKERDVNGERVITRIY